MLNKNTGNTISIDEIKQRAVRFVEGIPLERLENDGIYVDPFNYDYITGYPLGIYINPNGHETDPFSLGKEESVITKMPSAYIHIPFCSAYCTFCYFTKFVRANVQEEIAKYLSFLGKEIDIWKRHYESSTIHSLYIGGGTPSIMSEQNIQYLFETIIHKKLGINSGIEITFEGHPKDFTPLKVKLLKDLGVNRISVGTQSLKDSILSDTNRHHKAQDTLRAVETIAAHFDNYNVDFMYGFPNQTVEDVLSDIETAVEVGIPSLTFYRLEIHEDTPIWKVPKDRFPSAKDILLMKQAIADSLAECGYVQDNIDWFVRDKRFTFKQQHYKWSNNYYVGFGLGSYGFFNNVTYSNIPDFPSYYQTINNGELPVHKTHKLTKDELMRREAVFAMKITEGLNSGQFYARYNMIPQDYFSAEIAQLSNLGLIEVNQQSILLTEVGRLFSDQVAEFFYSQPIKEIVFKRRTKIKQVVETELALLI